MSKAKETLKLWVKAGGRCQFQGCNKYLLRDEEVSGLDTNAAEKAHIVGKVPSIYSPRGLEDLPIDERDLESNLMLLCPIHHQKIIDNPSYIKAFPTEILLQWKNQHEERIYSLTGIQEERKTIILKNLGNIRGFPASISDKDIRNAVMSLGLWPDRKNEIEINLNSLPQNVDDTYWQVGKQKIDEVLASQYYPRIERGEISNVSVFALSRIPLLIYLGFKMGDKPSINFFQKHRTSEKGWSWDNSNEKINCKLEKRGNSLGNEAVLVISFSGAINSKKYEVFCDDQTCIYELGFKLDSPHEKND